MYNLCKIDRNVNTNSVLGHPINVVFRSGDLRDIAAEIKKRILDGCPAKSLLVFENANVEILFEVSFPQEMNNSDVGNAREQEGKE